MKWLTRGTSVLCLFGALLGVFAGACSPGSTRSRNEIRLIRTQRYLSGLPVSLKYGEGSKTYVVGQSNAPFVPEVGGEEKFEVVSYEISGALPLGLSFDPASGIVSGIALQPMATQNFTVGLIGNGARVAEVEITLTVNDLPPQPFHYPGVELQGGIWSLDRLAPFDSFFPVADSGGGAVVSYSIPSGAPALPAGLVLNPLSGVISGVPTARSSIQTYTVRAVNSGGVRNFVFLLEVLEPLPSIPQGLQVTPGNQTLSLSWQALSPLAGAIESIKYRLERRIGGSASPWQWILDESTATSFQDSSLTNGVAVEYRVLARNSRGLSAPSPAVVGTPEAMPVPVLSESVVSIERGIALDPAVTITSSDATGPIHSCGIDPALPPGLSIVAVASLSGCRILGTPQVAVEGRTYTVTTTNFAGSGVASLFLEVRDPIPQAPYGVTASVLNSTSVSLTWQDPSEYERGFRVERHEVGDPGAFVVVADLLAPGTTQFLDATVPVRDPASQFEYRVVTLAVGVESSPSSVLTVTPMNRPQAPLLTQAQALVEGVRVEWSQVSGPGAITYQIFANGQLMASVPGTELEHVELGLVAGEPYLLSVKAVNVAGPSVASNEIRAVPQMVMSTSPNLIAVGAKHSCRLRTDLGGKVECWGSNASGQLGDGTTTSRPTPALVSGLQGAVSIAAGDHHTCVVMGDTTVKCWGEQSRGRLGNGFSSSAAVTAPTSVLGVSGPTLLGNVRSLSAGSQHTCAALYGGALYCWGSNSYGQLGVGQAPLVVPDLSRPAVVSIQSVAQVSTGTRHTCALLTTTEISCWGANTNGGLGDGGSLQRTAPVMVLQSSASPVGVLGYREVSAGNQYTCARHHTGVVRCWGRNLEGQLGDGTSVNRYYPVQVGGGLSGVRAIRTGKSTACAVLESEVSCWGANTMGEFGNGTQNPSATPVSSLLTYTLASGDPAPEIAFGSGSHHVYVGLGVGYLWGLNDEGQVGEGPPLKLAP